MEVKERLVTEQVFHDRQAGARRAFFEARPERLVVAHNDYLDHEPWIRPALAKFGDVRGRRLLDFGCGHGIAAVVLAQRGARVTAFDVAGAYLREAQARARANRVDIDFVRANGETLPFADAAFDCVWGNAVLHHLNMERAGQEIERVLKPGGLAVFCEPWGGNPLLNWARRHIPYSGKERTPDERPLTQSDVAVLRKVFADVQVDGYQFLSMVRRVIGPGLLSRTLASLDKRILTWLPFSQRWCRYIVVTLRK